MPPRGGYLEGQIGVAPREGATFPFPVRTRTPTAGLKTFRLKARGDAGAGKTELLTAFADVLRGFGMTAVLNEADHHLIVTATKAQRNALYAFNRKKPQTEGA